MKIKIEFEVEEKDLEGNYTWDDAVEACQEGWRLPTIAELQLMYENKEKLNMKDEGYWSSTVYDFYDARKLYFNDGNIYWNFKNYYGRVRCVRDVSKTNRSVV